MSEDDSPPLVYLAELEGLGDAHLIGVACDEAGIAHKVAKHRSSGFDVVVPHSWGMLYVDASKVDAALVLIQQVRDDERLADESYDPSAPVEMPEELRESDEGVEGA